jgi:hypothetical protein
VHADTADLPVTTEPTPRLSREARLVQMSAVISTHDHDENTMTVAEQRSVAVATEDAGPEAVVALREETCATLDNLDTAAKGRASIVRSCTESRLLSESDRNALKDLLRCITEQRKRLRAVRRLWQSIDVFERPSASLVEATQLCLQESRELAGALEPWRAHTVSQVAGSVSGTWARLADVIDHFLPAERGTPSRVRGTFRIAP